MPQLQGAIDTLTKPIQGTLDLVEGTASAFREVVGAPLGKPTVP
jgi:hypothetical protein